MRGPEFEAAVLAEWEAALSDAKLNTDARLWLCRGYDRLSGDVGARYYLPWLDIEDDAFLDAAQQSEAEADSVRPLHRVVIFADYRETKDDLGDALVPVFGAM